MRLRAPSIAAAVTLSLALGAHGRSAHAAGPADEAKALFDRGVELLEAKKVSEACPAFEKSNALDPKPGTLFTLAECEAQAGRLATAFTRYGEYLEVFGKLPRDKQLKQGTREKDAKAQRAALEPKIPKVTVVVTPAGLAGVTVRRDDAPIEPGAPAPIDPGEHVFRGEAAGRPPLTVKETFAPGDAKTITLDLKEAPKDAGLPAEPEGMSGRRIAALGIGGVGVAGLLVGAISGGVMLAKKSTVSAQCDDLGNGKESCTPAGKSAGNSAKTLGAVSSAGWIGGLVLTGVGAALFFTEPKKEPAKSGFRVAPDFAVGPGGAMAAARGRF